MDGWIEQRLSEKPVSSNKTVHFLIPFSDTNYTILEACGTDSGNVYEFTIRTNKLQTTQFEYNDVGGTTGLRWAWFEIKGY